MNTTLLDYKTKQIIQNANSIVFFTGAGISAESGIPTFRGKDGIWNKLKPEELANFNAFLKNPKLVWEWYQHRKEIIHNCQPNPAHKIIAEIQNKFERVSVVTQNIDNLHRRAGSKIVYELHGNIERNYCIDCNKQYGDNVPLKDGLPKCECGGLVRPDVVWFGEYLPQEVFKASEKEAEKCDVFFIVGTTGIVYPAASIIYIAKNSGAYLIEVNTNATDVSPSADKSFFGKAGEMLPQIFLEIL